MFVASKLNFGPIALKAKMLDSIECGASTLLVRNGCAGGMRALVLLGDI